MPKKQTVRTKRPSVAKPKRRAPKTALTARRASVAELRVQAIESIQREVAKSAELIPRWNANPEDVQKSVAQLVLALVEFLRKLLERQAIRRMEAETLDAEDVEKIGLALMRLEETVHDIAAKFGLSPEELNLDLGPLGRLS
jgi:hypothetical protein